MKILVYLVIGYGALLLYAQLVANHVMFPVPPASYQDDSNIVKLATTAGERIAVREFPSPNANYTIIYHHGNEEDVGRLAPMMEYYQEKGYAMVAYDYPGYGTSTGKPTEASTYRAAEAVYTYLTTKKGIPADKIVHLGSSIGCGVAIELAMRHQSGGVILLSPLVAAFQVITHVPLLPFDRYYNKNKIDKINAPLLIVHGTNDSIISVWHGRELFKRAKEPMFAYWVEGAGHNDLLAVAGERYWQELKRFFDAL